MHSNLKPAAFSLALFGFLSLMAWTGKLAQIDGFKLRIFTWVVEDLAVGNFGRQGAAILFAGIGVTIAAAIVRLSRTTEEHEDTPVMPGLFQRLRSQFSPETRSRDVGSAWMSRVRSNYDLGDKPGTRTKFYGHDWEPAEFVIPPMPKDAFDNMTRSGRGYALRREELPEAAAVWNEKRFARLGDIFWVTGFMVVRGKLAEVLSRFDLGEGGLVPFPFYKADLATPYPGDFFLINFGCIKNSLLPEQCAGARKWVVEKATGLQWWELNDHQPDAEVVLSQAALEGPDLWFEATVYRRLFMSQPLGQAIVDAGLGEVFDMLPCRVVEAKQQ